MVSLDLENITPYLLGSGVLDVESVVDGDLEIQKISGRNENFRVRREKKASFIVKQAYAGLEGADGSILREAQLYSLVDSDPDLAGVRPFMPRLVESDRESRVLISQFLPNSKSLNEHECDAPETSLNPAFILGYVLATLHSYFGQLLDDRRLGFLPRYTAPALGGVARPTPQVFADASPANLKLLRIIQEDETLSHFISTVAKGWQIQTVIHGDMGKENVLVQELSGGKVQMTIVDWEMAGKGDPAWDIACIIGDLLRTWVLTSTITKTMTAKEILSHNEKSFLKFQNDVRVFWFSYSKYSSRSMDSEALLRRSIRFLAGFLLQSAYQSVAYLSDLMLHSLYLVQISCNIVKDVDRAISHLLAIREF